MSESSAEAGRAERRAEAMRLLRQLNDAPGDQPEHKRARDRLVELHLPLVRYLARRFAGRSMPVEDLVQVGTIGLIKAIDRFDPDRGMEFSTYASPTILGEIKRYFRDTGWLVHVPRRAQELQTTLDRARGELSQQLGRAPTVPELAAHIGVDEQLVIEAIDVARSYAGVPLDALLEQTNGGGAVLAHHDVELERVELRGVLGAALATLPERHQRIMSLRFTDGMTQTEIARVVGVSQMQISRVISKSLAALREQLGDVESLTD